MECGNTFTVTKDDGQTVECSVLFTFESADSGKTYVVFTDESRDEMGNTMVYANILGKHNSLEPIETDEEWNVVEGILNQLEREARNGSFDGLDEDEVARLLEDRINVAPEPELDPEPYTLEDLNRDVDALNAFMRQLEAEMGEGGV
ncbi:Uncharacterized protein conserved in bacteria [Slackia heliotrinireducens]|uniref:Uncharacterized protein n=1 Tax=Slackia heliotrinireducens (strain ATCC 29202 / DSM 20476 / NCTC 11029 / RHS 1) TaxID=471855 RepID=C7N5F6_SLAHD|nr:DUF1292 domain-containing protein [Slackia heliotrinireducens]ACV22141.1 Protein of unknown function (DUF1292) [Slackia heliotrinireducens DSM 20476]VEH00184.1 Uncharacterized protein conserved in bacteria [Slackia heliotrinireducens]